VNGMNFPKSMIPSAGSLENLAVQTLCKKLVEQPEPIYLDVEQIDGMEVSDCTNNVAQMVAAKGGSVQYGWQIWQTQRLVEAEFHAVWIDSDGNPHDITPKGMFNITQILFLPDPTIVYTGRQIDNVRVPVNENDELIKEFISINERYFEASNRGDLADQYGEIVATPEMVAIMMERDRISLKLLKEEPTLQKKTFSKKVGRNEPCPCQSGKKYKRCCGQ